MTEPKDDIPKLADLHIDTIRRENDHVDTRLAELEDEKAELESEKAELESEMDSIRTEKEATEELIADIRDGQRQKQLNRIKEANEAVDEDNEVDLSTLEDASVDQLETVADMIESASGATTVSNGDRTPDLGGADPNEDTTDLEELKAEVAESNGLGGLYESYKNGDLAGPRSAGATSETSVKDLLDAAEGVEGGN